MRGRSPGEVAGFKTLGRRGCKAARPANRWQMGLNNGTTVSGRAWLIRAEPKGLKEGRFASA